MFSGNLKLDSPSLYGILSRTLSSIELEHVVTAFKDSIEKGSAKEKREEGLSFNPRPARIAEILIKEANVTSTETISASFYASLYENKINFTSNLSANCTSLVNEVHLFLKNESLINNVECKKISLAYCIDYTRRIHIEKPSENKLNSFFKKVNYLLSLEDPSLVRLKTILSSHPSYKKS